MTKGIRILCMAVAVVVLLLAGLTFGANYLMEVGIARASVNETPDPFTDADAQRLDGVTYEETYITAHDGLALFGRVYAHQPPAKNWVLTLHGHTSTGSDMFDYTERLYAMGYNVLAPDLRAHGNTEGDFAGMGWTDRFDVITWCEYIQAREPDAQIALFGLSMGAATVMMASGEALPPAVKSAVEDCGYSTVYDEFYYQMGEMYPGLPRFPLMDIAGVVSKLRAGYSFKEASSVAQVARATVPMLFIHGDADVYTPFWMLNEVYAAHPGEKERLAIAGAGHAKSHEVEPEVYWQAVGDFIGRYFE